MKIEITKDLSLSAEQTSLLDMHSFLNMMNVLMSQFLQLGTFLDDSTVFKDCRLHCKDIIDVLTDHDRALERIRNISDSQKMMHDTIRTALAKRPDVRNTDELLVHTGNIESIFNVIDARVREILARANQPDAWNTFQINDLTENFHEIFTAIERNAKGKYRIVYNIASQHALDYFINFKVTSPDSATILMPPVLIDVMRDLILNARKYTPLGGSIIAGLNYDGKDLSFVVKDDGRGIPSDEIEHVVDYGFRASNVADKDTNGGGFGLTKAFFVTRQHGGRMWIDSEIDTGTAITITIPSQATA